jgi:hypothetical protein
MTPSLPNDEERLLCGGMSNNFSSRRYRCKGTRPEDALAEDDIFSDSVGFRA